MATKTQRHKNFYKLNSSLSTIFLSAFVSLWQKKSCLIYAVLLFSALSSCTGADKETNVEYIHQDSLYLIPQPMSLEKRENSFKLDVETHLIFAPELESEGNYLSNLIESSSTFSVPKNLKSKTITPTIELKLVNEFPPELQNGEAYRLIISEDEMQITALTPVGIMRGIQTLRQLFIPAFHAQEKRSAWYVPCLKIEDAPAFEHRGLLLDVCRHFFEKDVILKYIDLLAYYKMNILHLHLTEDQGWRIQIDKYPKLNKISSWRKDTTENLYGGFYTKTDLKEIVAYAKERHITVIPEIELPGHSQAALAAYPQFSCNGGPIEVANDWGVFKEIYCAGNDSTFIFLEDILKEVMEIFPSEYIHIGGDESPKFRWEHCAKCQKKMKDEGLANEHELQSYFIQRIEKFLNDNRRKLIGWDEILEGGLSENATVQSWRGMDGGLAAAKDSHYVIMSPTSHCYLDYGLDAIDLKKVFEFNPIPEGLDKSLHKYILGAECNMWTEHVPDKKNLDSKVFPRLIAMAEVLWANPDKNNFNEFYLRLQKHYPVLELFGVDYGSEMLPAKINTSFSDSHELVLLINKNLDDLDIKCRWNCPDCDTNFTDCDYHQPFLDTLPFQLELRAFKNGKLYGEPIFQKIEFHKGVYANVTYKTNYNKSYDGGGIFGLVDGKLGSENFRDGNWQGFFGVPIELDIDLRARGLTKISYIGANFYYYSNAWIFLPEKFQFSHSNDGVNWTTCYVIPKINHRQYIKAGQGIQLIESEIETPISMRYLKIKIEGIDKVPDWHEAAGQDSWLFIDEIILQ